VFQGMLKSVVIISLKEKIVRRRCDSLLYVNDGIRIEINSNCNDIIHSTKDPMKGR